uniref:Secreted protein n=1 Tax=Rhabditophanes sp. KR3021 TaxID=114890 RepID=A0AC35TI36_9BILA
MKFIFFLTVALVVSAKGSFIEDIFNLPTDVLSVIPLTNDSTSPVYCNDAALSFCQYQFDVAAGIATTNTWRTGNDFLKAILTVLGNSDVGGLLKVCQARQAFNDCLGSQYSACVNTYHLIGETNAGENIGDAYTYVATYAELDFICNEGLGIAISSWKQLSALDGSKAALACHAIFQTGMATNPGNMCGYADQYAKCLQGVFNTRAGFGDGWWKCELIRNGFAKYCSNTCTLTSSP